MGIAFIFACQFAILITWSVVSPMSAASVELDSLGFTAERRCIGEHKIVWLALEACYFGLLLMWSIFVVYSTWGIKAMIIESRWVSSSYQRDNI
jgi:hypothetical protein